MSMAMFGSAVYGDRQTSYGSPENTAMRGLRRRGARVMRAWCDLYCGFRGYRARGLYVGTWAAETARSVPQTGHEPATELPITPAMTGVHHERR